MAIDRVPRHYDFDRRFFLAVAFAVPLLVLIGFGPTFYLKPFFERPPLANNLLIVHGVIMTAWIGLIATQVYLVRSKQIKLHQKIGILGIAMAAMVIISGFAVGVDAGRRGAAPPGIDPLSFMIVPLGDVIVFGILFGAAVYYRKQPANHKPLILLTILNFLPPAFGRFPFAAAGSPPFFYGIPTLLTIAFIALDTWRNGKVNKVFLFGGIFLIAAMWARLFLSGTPAWMNLATWIIS